MSTNAEIVCKLYRDAGTHWGKAAVGAFFASLGASLSTIGRM
jgi:hypothetical protein